MRSPVLVLVLVVLAALALTNDALVRIPLKKFRSIRRELTDSGRRADELLADRHSLKYNLGFPSSNGPTPETLKNYLDVSMSASLKPFGFSRAAGGNDNNGSAGGGAELGNVPRKPDKV